VIFKLLNDVVPPDTFDCGKFMDCRDEKILVGVDCRFKFGVSLEKKLLDEMHFIKSKLFVAIQVSKRGDVRIV
jgi:hypothetical protein